MVVRAIVLLFTLLVIGVSCTEFPQENGVYVLSPDNFDEFIAQFNNALIEFYAPWCGHCKKLAPEYEAAAAVLQVPLAKVDAAEHRSLGERYGVRGFPTLFWFEGGNAQPYEGGRTKDTIVSWITKRTTSSLPLISSVDDLNTEKSGDGITIVLFEGSENQKNALLQVFRSTDFFSIFEVTDSAVTSAANAQAGSVLAYASHLDTPLSSSEDTLEALIAFCGSAFPTVVEFDPSHFQRMAGSKDVVIVGVAHYNVEGEKERLISYLDAVDPSRAGLMYADAALLSRGVESAGASGKFYPTVIAINPKTNQQIVWDENQELNEESIKVWAEQVLDGTAQTFKKSEEIPENAGALTTLVWKNWDSISGKNAFVKFYAPWCGHCKSLAPVWDELAEAYAEQDVIIAKFDATANYHDQDVTGFPTLFFFHADGTKEKFEGGRDLESLVAFVNSKIGGSATAASTSHDHSHDEL